MDAIYDDPSVGTHRINHLKVISVRLLLVSVMSGHLPAVPIHRHQLCPSQR